MPVTRDINYAALNLRDALDLAVLIEEEARDRYEELAQQLTLHHTEAAAAFFLRMARVEELHRTQLAERRLEAFGAEPQAVTRAMIFDIEAPDYDEARAFMTVREALQTALRAEEKAHAFFVAALPHLHDRAVHELFTELCEEEVEHQALVKGELARLPPDDPGHAADYGDEPSPQ